MTGIRAVGRTGDGHIVAVRSKDAPATGPIAVTIVPVGTSLLRFAAFLSIASALLLLGLIVWALNRFRVREWEHYHLGHARLD
jgi:hypothetical protein